MTSPAFGWMNISPSCPFRGSIKVKGLSVCIFRRVGVRTPNEFRTPQQSCAHFTVAQDWCPRGRRGAQQKPSPAAARGAGGAAVHGAPLEPRSVPSNHGSTEAQPAQWPWRAPRWVNQILNRFNELRYVAKCPKFGDGTPPGPDRPSRRIRDATRSRTPQRNSIESCYIVERKLIEEISARSWAQLLGSSICRSAPSELRKKAPM